MTDILITWPKAKPLQTYLDTLAWAEREGRCIHFRVGRGLPQELHQGERCFVSHRGLCHGYNIVVAIGRLEEGEVEGWPAGNYITRSPEWHPLPKPQPTWSGRGFIYLDPAQIDHFLGITRAPDDPPTDFIQDRPM